jgi:tripartite-type tricarboxylate transporter receptor subunit TctC
MFRRAVAIALAVTGLIAAAAPALADDYPSRTVSIIVPYPAGGPTDELARLLAQSLSTKLKQNFIVENVTGGGTIIGTHRVTRAAPDGYTLLLHNLQISANVTLYKKLPFDTEKDLAPIIFINRNPLVLVGRKSLAANSLKDLLAAMQKTTMKAAIPGFGATGHLATSLVAQEDKAKVDMIPYRGAAPALQDILGEHVDIFFATPQSVVQQVAAGQMKAYGITSKEKSSQFPQADSFVSVLGPKLEIQFWQALFAPAGTPDAVINKLNAAVQEFQSDPATQKHWAAEGVEGYPKEERTVAAARTILKSEIDRWGEVIRANNIHLDQ